MFDFDEDSCNQCAIEEDIIIAEPAPLESTVATTRAPHTKPEPVTIPKMPEVTPAFNADFENLSV